MRSRGRHWRTGLWALLAPLTAAAGPALEVEGAWVRALPPTQTSTAAYLSARNPGAATQTVVGASADIAARVEIHTTRERDGMLRMEQLQELRIDPGERVDLAPGGAHLMLLELSRMPAPGEDVRLCLQLASGEEVCTVAPAHKAGPGAGADDPHRHH